MLQGKDRFEIVGRSLPCHKYGCMFRLVEPGDASFIYKLRTDSGLSRHVNSVSNIVEDQVKWIKDYKSREANGNEFYLISVDPVTGSRQGVNRLYDFKDDSFELGSWLYLPNEDISKSILGDIFAKELGFEALGFDFCTFNVRKVNLSVIRYHQGYQPDLVSHDELNLYFKLTRAQFNRNKIKYLKICGYGENA